MGPAPTRAAIAATRVPVTVIEPVAVTLPPGVAEPALVPTQAAKVDRRPLAAPTAIPVGVAGRRRPPVPVTLRGTPEEGAVARRVAACATEAPAGTAAAETLPVRAATRTATAAGAGAGARVAARTPTEMAPEEAQAEGARAPMVAAGAAIPRTGTPSRAVEAPVAPTLVALATGMGPAA